MSTPARSSMILGGPQLRTRKCGMSAHTAGLESTPLCPLGNRKACVARSPCPLHVPFQKVWEAQAAFLAETTLAGFAARKVPAPPRRR